MEVREVAKRMKDEGYYLIGITVIDIGKYFEIIYHFSREKNRKNIRFIVRKGEKIPTISDIFPNAFLYEWEEYEAFGIKFENAEKLFGEKSG